MYRHGSTIQLYNYTHALNFTTRGTINELPHLAHNPPATIYTDDADQQDHIPPVYDLHCKFISRSFMFRCPDTAEGAFSKLFSDLVDLPEWHIYTKMTRY